MISTGYRAIGAALAAPIAALAAGGCDAGAGVEIALSLPDDPKLAPDRQRLAEITLVTERPGAGRRSETRRFAPNSSAAIDMGRLDVASDVSLSLELRSPTRRLVGYGRTAEPIAVRSGGPTITAEVRRPFAYVTGSTSLAAFDTTIEGGAGDYRSTIELPALPAAAAPTQSGAEIVVVTAGADGSELRILSTATHRDAGFPPVALTAPSPRDVAVTPDGRHAIVGHATAEGGVTVVELPAVREGEAEPVFVPLGRVGTVTVPDDPGAAVAYALVDPALALACPDPPSPSAVAAIPLDAPDEAAVTSYGSRLQDIAALADGVVAVADSCAGELKLWDVRAGAEPSPLARLPRASSVAVRGERVWGAGSVTPGGDGSRVRLVSVDDSGLGESRLELAPAQERARSLDLTDDGQAVEQRLDAELVWVLDMAIVPGADHVALLTYESYRGAEIPGDFGGPLVPEMTVDTYEYLLVDVSTTGLAQRLRTSCKLVTVQDPEPALDSWECASAPDQDVVPQDRSFIPLRVATLFGAR